MSEKDVKDNETEALNNAAAENAENADIEAGETDMATSIESVDFAVVYDDGGSTTFPWRSMPARPTRCWWMPKMSNSIRRWWPPWSA